MIMLYFVVAILLIGTIFMLGYDSRKHSKGAYLTTSLVVGLGWPVCLLVLVLNVIAEWIEEKFEL